MAKQDMMRELMIKMAEIDRDHNGYVTRNELDDILKLLMKESLNNYNLAPIINKFSSIQNKILIDYNRFHKWIVQENKKYI